MSKFEMDTEFVRKLAEILEQNHLGEIELSDGARRIRVARPPVPMMAAPPVAMAAASPAAAVATTPVVPVVTAVDSAANPGAVKSPMVGTAYLSPEPGKPLFVRVGDKVTAGQTLLIIEAMKTFNPIKAPKAGTVSQVLIENAQPVEFGQPLMIVE